jgi:hypothetical protein
MTAEQLAAYRLLASDKPVIPLKPMLFNLLEDPGETRDVLDSNQALAAEIHARYVAQLVEWGTPEEHLSGRRSLL